MRKVKYGTLALLLIVTFTACSKKNNPAPNKAYAGLMAFNMAQDQGQVRILIDETYLNSYSMPFASYSGTYQGVDTGNRKVISIDNAGNTTLAQTITNFKESKYYTMVVMGLSGTYQNVVIEDKFSDLPSTSPYAFVRYINAIPDGGTFHVKATTTTNSTVFDEDNTMGAASGFKQVEPGDLKFTLTKPGGSLNVMDTIHNLTSGSIYTVFLYGTASAPPTSPEKSIQIKYIKNGSL